MPNWCTNNLIVSGDIGSVFYFNNDFKGQPSPKQQYGYKRLEDRYCFNAIRPMPEGVDWYDWSVENWGTKWDIYHYGFNKHDIEILSLSATAEAFYSFDTAWAPPEAFVEYASKLYPNLVFTLNYFEGGMMFAGSTTYRNGNVIDYDFREGDPKQVIDLALNLELEDHDNLEEDFELNLTKE